MAQYITKIRTEQGDMQIDYNALANLPTSAEMQASHNHDNRYYDTSEIDSKLNAKSNTDHTHTYSDVGAIPKILTSGEYGTEFPTKNLVNGQIFFKKV